MSGILDKNDTICCIRSPLDDSVVVCVDNVKIQIVVDNDTGGFVQLIRCTTRVAGLSGNSRSNVRIRWVTLNSAVFIICNVQKSIAIESKALRFFQLCGATPSTTIAISCYCRSAGSILYPFLNTIILGITDVDGTIGINLNTARFVELIGIVIVRTSSSNTGSCLIPSKPCT